MNSKGIYGLTYSVMDTDIPFEFKASDISRKFTYANIQSHFSSEPLLHDNTIHRVGEWREALERDNEYMSHSALPLYRILILPAVAGKIEKMIFRL